MAVYNAGLFYFISNYSRMIKVIILYQDISQNVLIYIRDIPNDEWQSKLSKIYFLRLEIVPQKYLASSPLIAITYNSNGCSFV